MREGVLRMNADHRDVLSNDLGAIGGLLFDVGRARYLPPPRDNDPALKLAWLADIEKVREDTRTTADDARDANDRSHTDVQRWLRDLGLALGYAVHIAVNDRNRECGAGRLGEGCLAELPSALREAPGADAVRLIDVLWIKSDDVARFGEGLKAIQSVSRVLC